MSWKFFEVGLEKYLIASNTVSPGITVASTGVRISHLYLLLIMLTEVGAKKGVWLLHKNSWNNSFWCFYRQHMLGPCARCGGRLNLTHFALLTGHTWKAPPKKHDVWFSAVDYPLNIARNIVLLSFQLVRRNPTVYQVLNQFQDFCLRIDIFWPSVVKA